MKNTVLNISCFLLALFTISSCTKIPKIQSGNEVQYIYDSKVMMKDGVLLKMVKDDSQKATTIVLVRHAEKMKDQKDPNLTNEGSLRATKLKDILSTIPLNQIYSTDYNRTQQTAKPTSSAQEIEIMSYNPSAINDFGKMLLQTRKGENILVVGHSNTTPKLLNYFLKEKVVESISESDYGNIYIVNIDQKGNAKALVLRF
jgi:2,3-bisphosphoglycerate-dependent phosphoglycerate mutase